jgi:hypothetical protein
MICLNSIKEMVLQKLIYMLLRMCALLYFMMYSTFIFSIHIPYEYIRYLVEVMASLEFSKMCLLEAKWNKSSLK